MRADPLWNEETTFPIFSAFCPAVSEPNSDKTHTHKILHSANITIHTFLEEQKEFIGRMEIFYLVWWLTFHLCLFVMCLVHRVDSRQKKIWVGMWSTRWKKNRSFSSPPKRHIKSWRMRLYNSLCAWFSPPTGTCRDEPYTRGTCEWKNRFRWREDEKGKFSHISPEIIFKLFLYGQVYIQDFPSPSHISHVSTYADTHTHIIVYM